MMENLLQEVLFFTALFKKVGHHLPAQTCSLFSHSLSAKLVTSLHYGVGEDSWESLGLHGDPTSRSWCSLEGLMLKLKLQYFGHLMRRVDSLEKTDAGRDWGQEEKGTTEDEMAGWHHRLDGCEFEWTPGVGDRQGGLACCNSWGRKKLDTNERLNWTELKEAVYFPLIT